MNSATSLSICTAIACLMITSCASNAPLRNFQAPSVRPVKEKITESQEHIRKAQTSAKNLEAATAVEARTKEWQAAYDEMVKEQDLAQLALVTAQKNADELQVQNDTLAQGANKADQERVKAVEKERLTVFKYHRVKALLAACASAVVAGAMFLFGAKLLALCPPPYNLIPIIGAPAAAAAAVFFFL